MERTKKRLHPENFDIINIPKRLKKTGDLFKGVLGKCTDIKKRLKNLGE
jgi:DNA primase